MEESIQFKRVKISVFYIEKDNLPSILSKIELYAENLLGLTSIDMVE